MQGYISFENQQIIKAKERGYIQDTNV